MLHINSCISLIQGIVKKISTILKEQSVIHNDKFNQNKLVCLVFDLIRNLPREIRQLQMEKPLLDAMVCIVGPEPEPELVGLSQRPTSCTWLYRERFLHWRFNSHYVASEGVGFGLEYPG